MLTLFLAAAIAIQPEAIRAHMSFLADDLLEGRGTGTRGFEIAAQYVRAQYDSYGLRSEFQRVPFLKTTPQEAAVTIGDRVLKFGDDFTTYGEALRDEAVVEAPVVFVGYGVTAPERNYDDYAGIDAHGKIVAFLVGGPKSFPSEIRAHYSSSRVKLENAAAHGATGIFTIRTPYEERTSQWSRTVRQSKLGAMHWLERDGSPHATRREIVAAIPLSRSGAEALFAGAPSSLNAVFEHPVAFDLPARATIRVVSGHQRVESENVIGVLPGSDPNLRDEVLVYSAHLDHLGISEPVNGDAINNGALDNASGIAAMLEIARGFAANRPRRSILFLATTGEEKGLRGADYFANNPTVPAKSIVADINIDEILMMTPTTDVVILGAEHSTLGDVAADISGRLHIAVSPDPYPDEADFVRSDQYPFVKRGIPAIYIGAGYKATDPKIDAKALQLRWIETLYHTPRDDMSQPLDFGEGAMVARFAEEVGREVANAGKRPLWNKGDFFGEKFAFRPPTPDLRLAMISVPWR